MLGKEIQQAISGTAEGRTDVEILNEMYGRGNDVKSFRLVQALINGDARTVTDELVASDDGNGWDHRIIEKALRFFGAGLKIAQNWEQGAVIRDALFADIIPDQTIVKLLVELDKNEAFRTAIEKNAVQKAQMEDWLNELARTGNLSSDSVGNVRTMLRRSATRQTVNQVMRTLRKVIPPDVKNF